MHAMIFLFSFYIFFFFLFVHKQGQHLNKQPPGQGAAPVYLSVGGLCSDWSHLCRVSGAQLSPLVLLQQLPGSHGLCRLDGWRSLRRPSGRRLVGGAGPFMLRGGCLRSYLPAAGMALCCIIPV